MHFRSVLGIGALAVSLIALGMVCTDLTAQTFGGTPVSIHTKGGPCAPPWRRPAATTQNTGLGNVYPPPGPHRRTTRCKRINQRVLPPIV